MNGQGLAAPLRPEAVVFDVNETLTDLTPLQATFTRIGLGDTALRWWFAVLLRDGFALTAAGDAATFATLATTALDEVAAASGRDLPDGAGADVLEAFGRAPVRPDVAPALARLQSVGVPAFALTNGGAPVARRILGAGGVADLFADVLSVDRVGHWKPRPEPYRYAAEVADVPPERLALVAVHPWDLHGAASAGLTTGWVDRVGTRYPAVFRVPTVQSTDLEGVVERLLTLGTA